MPISKSQVLEIVRRLSKGASLDTLAARLDPSSQAGKPVPPDVPRPSDATATGRDARLEFLRERGVEVPHLAGREPQADPEALRGNIEQFIGMTQIPTGLIGPLRVNGLHAHGDYYVPLATSEGALVASYHRGARLATRAGGISALVTAEQVQRAPGFEFDRIADAGRFGAWAAGEFERFREVAATCTRHGQLVDAQVHLESRCVYLIFAFHTGDAAGQNMVTFCTAAVCDEILA